MDIFLKEKKNYIIAAAAAFAGCLLMIFNSEIAVLSAKKGISLWLSDVLPAMLPFFICVNFLNFIGVIRYLPRSIFPFIMSVLSGYPMGAKLIGDMYRSDSIDKKEAKRLLSFCSTSGPVFIIGAVGVGMLGSHEAGIIAAVAHYLGAICNGVLFSFVYPRKIESVEREGTEDTVISGNLVELFTDSIFHSFKSLSIILAYIVIFMFFTDMLEQAGFFDLVSSGAGAGLMRGFFEMTVGCSFLEDASLSLKYSCTLAAVIISWGGLSIIGQSVSMLAGTKISVLYLVLVKITHSFFAGIIALFIGNLVL